MHSDMYFRLRKCFFFSKEWILQFFFAFFILIFQDSLHVVCERSVKLILTNVSQSFSLFDLYQYQYEMKHV